MQINIPNELGFEILKISEKGLNVEQAVEAALERALADHLERALTGAEEN